MEKEKVLEIEFQKVWDMWAWKMTKNEGYKEADGCVAVNIEKKTLYHFNSFYNCWDEIKENSLISTKLKEDIEKIVELINEKHGIPKRWRGKRSDKYFTIFGDNEISETTDNYFPEDQRRYEWGNYFKTLEEAEKVKAELDKFWEKVRAGEIGG